jgi:O-antigen ligase
VGHTWRRRIRVTPVEAGLLLAALAFPVVVALVVQSIDRSPDPDDSAIAVPLADRVNDTFFDTSKRASAETRQNLWSDGMERIQNDPLVGSGLGTEYRVERALVDDDLVGGGFHNILFDVAVRSGVAGFLLFAIACSFTVSAAVRTWRRHSDPRIAALAMGALVALAGLLAKGMVESVFEKYRLAVLVGVLLGVIGSASASERRVNSAAASEALTVTTTHRNWTAPNVGGPLEH